jgi:hypothetical protein
MTTYCSKVQTHNQRKFLKWGLVTGTEFVCAVLAEAYLCFGVPYRLV